MSTQPSVIIDHKEIQKIEKNVNTLVGQARDLTLITDNDEYEFSGHILQEIVDRRKIVEKYFATPAKQAHDLHKWITTERGKWTGPLDTVELHIKKLRQDFRYEQEQVRQIKEQEERKKAAKEQEEAMLKEAKRLHDIGEKEASEEVVQQAALAPPPPVFVPSTVPKQQGKSIRKSWEYRVANRDLIKREFMMPDDKAIGALVRKLGPDAARIVGGIEITEIEIESVRSSGGSRDE